VRSEVDMNKYMIVECNDTIMTFEEAEKLDLPIYEVSDSYIDSILEQSYQAFMNGEEHKVLSAKNTGKRIK
jgi:hypothetical protein